MCQCSAVDTEAWTNEAAIATWAATPREFLASLDPDGGFAKRHLVNPFIFALLGDVRHQRILDAGCGQGYLSRLLAERGAEVVGVEPAASLFDYAIEREEELRQGIRYVQADLAAMPELGAFDAVIASMVLCALPNWRPAMKTCVEALQPGGLFIFTLNHPCFEMLATSWQQHAFMKVERYLHEYEIAGPHGTDFHRPLSSYLNELAALGCTLVELIEPALPADALNDHEAGPGAEAYLDVPNFVLVSGRRKDGSASSIVY
jgi:2-polyprenyl-3-methyl-5-hydroxy-6-metoxy-1,4-benzoquinol methylase